MFNCEIESFCDFEKYLILFCPDFAGISQSDSRDSGRSQVERVGHQQGLFV
jgi:hypothetical protein